MIKPNLLYLVHRIPFPPNKGDKIRTFNFLKNLSKHYSIHLGAFIDDLNDEQYIPLLDDYCVSINIVRINPLKSKIKSLSGLFLNKPLTLQYYTSGNMQKWVDHTVSKYNIDNILLFCSSMAQFVERYDNLNRIADFIDIDSDKWMQYATQKSWPLSWLYQREGETLRVYENKIADQFNAIFFVSKFESELFKKQIKNGNQKIHYINNGVDYRYFSSENTYESPYLTRSNKLLFVGAMDYWPNIDAVIWFAGKIFPAIKRIVPDVELFIVGSNPTEEVKRLSTIKSINVTGRVDDVRPYMYYSDMIIAPLRIARGVQNKVLEAMSMQKHILATNLALEGIEHEDTIKGFSVDEIDKMVNYVFYQLNNNSNDQDFINMIKKHYDWEKNSEKLHQLIG